MATPELRAFVAATYALDTLDQLDNASTTLRTEIDRLTLELHAASVERDSLRAQVMTEKAAREKAEEALGEQRHQSHAREELMREDEEEIHHDREQLADQMDKITTKIEAMAERRVRRLSGFDSRSSVSFKIAEFQALAEGDPGLSLPVYQAPDAAIAYRNFRRSLLDSRPLKRARTDALQSDCSPSRSSTSHAPCPTIMKCPKPNPALRPHLIRSVRRNRKHSSPTP
ncbi:hypothetical protein DFH06DRAFT_1230258 [Mycena polygramma]|nr:hypothetical protein DFH06DRAFT_1230258 [Mycena polygramma]